MTTRLHLGDHRTTLDVACEAQTRERLVIAIGTTSLAQRHFRHQPPTAAELEAAIDTVEDALMPHIPRLRESQSLRSDDDESIALAAFAGLPTDTAVELGLEDVERQFNRLADVANGRPASHEGLPARPAFAAHLLILRELMHHADRRSLTVVPPTAPADIP